jgi:hypothetical protein
VAGVLIDNRHDLLFSSDRGCARASIFRASDEELLGQVAVGGHPNGLAYDPGRGHLFTFNLGDPPGVGCTASVVALDGMRVLATIPLSGRPRWAMFDGDTGQVFVNIQKPAVIAAINCETLKVDGAYTVPSEGPHGMAIVGDRICCAVDGQALVVLSRVSGEIIASLDLPGVPDVVMVDQGLAHTPWESIRHNTPCMRSCRLVVGLPYWWMPCSAGRREPLDSPDSNSKYQAQIWRTTR